MKKTKWLKTAKFVLLAVLALSVLIVPISALYAESSVNSPLYSSPIKFNFSTYTGVSDSYVTELTPTIRFTSGGTQPSQLVQSSYYYDPNEHTDDFIGTWTFTEPLENVAETLLPDGQSEVVYKFSFTYNVNNTGETKLCYGIRCRKITETTTDNTNVYYVISYLTSEDGASNIIAYRTKRGEFAYNSYQTINVLSEPPIEVKNFLKADGLRISNTLGEVVVYNNFSAKPHVNDGVLSVSYDLNIPTFNSSDGFKIKVTADSGYYNPNLALNPCIRLPANVGAIVNRTYRIYDISGRYVDYKTTNLNITRGGVINLLGSMPTEYFMITDYEMTIELIVETPVGEWGDLGYYQWYEEPPQYTTALWEAIEGLKGQDYTNRATVRLPSGSMVNGVVIYGIILSSGEGSIWYVDESAGENRLIYNYSTKEWYMYDYDIEEWTVETVKTIYINGSVDEFVFYNDEYKEAFIPWFESATTYSTAPTIGGTSSGVNVKDLFSVEYYALNERLNENTADDFMNDYHNSVFQSGYESNMSGNGSFVDYTSWLANATSGFLDFELFPNFSLGGLLGILISFAVVVLFLKFFAGG